MIWPRLDERTYPKCFARAAAAFSSCKYVPTTLKSQANMAKKTKDEVLAELQNMSVREVREVAKVINERFGATAANPAAIPGAWIGNRRYQYSGKKQNR